MFSRTASSLQRAHTRDSFTRLIFQFEHQLEQTNQFYKRSLLFRFCHLMTLLLRSVTFLSYIVLAYIAYYRLGPDQLRMNLPIYLIFVGWMITEALFFPYYYYLFTQLDQLNNELDHFASDKATRFQLVQNSFNALRSGAHSSTNSTFEEPVEKYLRKVMEGWFLDTPLIKIYRGNCAEWTSWAFFGKDWLELRENEKEENEEIVTYIESKLKWRFPDGTNKYIPTVRLNLDPLYATQRPFFFYATIAIVNTLSSTLLHLVGYRQLPQFATPKGSQLVYYRPADPTSHRKLPIVFVHGIGIGFAHYLGIILNFPRDTDVFLIEWPYVAMQMKSAAPHSEQSVQAILSLLDHFGHDQFCFVAHSLGTVLLSWFLHQERSASRVATSVLLDPVIFLLSDPTIATMFVYKPPNSTLDFLMHFFLSRELFIANALSRHFAWSHNIMFVEEFFRCHPKGLNTQETVSNSKSNRSGKPLKHTIILSSHDVIVPVGPVSRYLESKSNEFGNELIELLMFHGTHGEMMLHPRWVQIISSKVKERVE